MPAGTGLENDMDNLLLIKKAKEGDRMSRTQVINQNLGLVWSIVRRYTGRGYDSEDLFQIGSIGLIKAIDKFDLSYGVQFSTYAIPLISGEIKRFLRDDGMIKVSRSLKENALRIRLARERLMSRWGREPSIEEIGEELGMDAEEIVMAEAAVTEVDSLNKTICQGDGSEVIMMDKIESGKNEERDVVNKVAVETALDALEGMESQLIRMRYYEERTQAQVAEQLGISQVQVSRLEKKILKKLRENLAV